MNVVLQGSGPKVSVWDLQNRPGRKRPWMVRWKVGVRPHSKGFPTKTAADNFRAQILSAANAGTLFDRETGEPVAWNETSLTVADWCGTWFKGEYPTWAPHTRKNHAQALGRVLPMIVKQRAVDQPDNIHTHIEQWLSSEAEMPRWLSRWSLPLTDLTSERCVSIQREIEAVKVLDRRASRTTPGTMKSISASDIKRNVKTIKAALNHAVRVGVISVNPWTTTTTRRKALQVTTVVDESTLPTPTQAVALLAGIPNHQPSSEGYRVLLSCVYYMGLRPSEARALRIEHCDLPKKGWGKARIREAIQDAGSRWTADSEMVGTPKTGSRDVPIPPLLVDIIREWIGDRTEGLIVQTKSNRPVGLSNLDRAMRRVSDGMDHTWSPYDLRHACATLWLSAGVPIREVANRLGHSPEILLSTYAGVLTGDEQFANKKIEQALNGIYKT
jgi:integrase